MGEVNAKEETAEKRSSVRGKSCYDDIRRYCAIPCATWRQRYPSVEERIQRGVLARGNNLAGGPSHNVRVIMCGYCFHAYLSCDKYLERRFRRASMGHLDV